MTKQSAAKPYFLTEAHLIFLSRLQNSGKTNMMAAPAILRQAFPNLNEKESYTIFWYWVDTFNEEKK